MNVPFEDSLDSFSEFGTNSHTDSESSFAFQQINRGLHPVPPLDRHPSQNDFNSIDNLPSLAKYDGKVHVALPWETGDLTFLKGYQETDGYISVPKPQDEVDVIEDLKDLNKQMQLLFLSRNDLDIPSESDTSLINKLRDIAQSDAPLDLRPLASLQSAPVRAFLAKTPVLPPLLLEHYEMWWDKESDGHEPQPARRQLPQFKRIVEVDSGGDTGSLSVEGMESGVSYLSPYGRRNTDRISSNNSSRGPSAGHSQRSGELPSINSDHMHSRSSNHRRIVESMSMPTRENTFFSVTPLTSEEHNDSRGAIVKRKKSITTGGDSNTALLTQENSFNGNSVCTSPLRCLQSEESSSNPHDRKSLLSPLSNPILIHMEGSAYVSKRNMFGLPQRPKSPSRHLHGPASFNREFVPTVVVTGGSRAGQGLVNREAKSAETSVLYTPSPPTNASLLQKSGAEALSEVRDRASTTKSRSKRP